jgi:undecaprenyl-diphosphatase
MDVWTAIILGIVEGLTEFLPVSSTGHLILVGHALGFTGASAVTFEIAIQLGSILSVFVYFRRRLWTLVELLPSDPASRRLLMGIGVAFLPAAFVGLASHRWIEAHLFGPVTVAYALVAGGVIILVVEHFVRERRIFRLEEVGVREAWWVGVTQCVSLFPGVSRSGATIIGGLLTGMDRSTAIEFSFLLALPTMVAATGYKIFKSHDLLFQDDLLLFPIGLAVAFLTGLLVIAGFLTFIKTHTFKPFAYYRIALGLLILGGLG